LQVDSDLVNADSDIAGFSKLVVWHERTHYDPGHQWARTLLVETCGALDGTEGQSVQPSDQAWPESLGSRMP
jgi:hypothetical protein